MRAARPRTLARTLSLGLAIAAATVASTSCGSDNGSGPKPTISISFDPSSASIQQGGTDTVAISVTHTGTFSGPIAFNATGIPADVSTSLVDTSTTGNTTTGKVAIDVASSAAPGTYPIVVHATSPGATEGTATFTLTVTAAPTPTFSLAVSGSPVTVAQGANGTVNVTITRGGGFAGAVALTLEGAPTGVSGTFTPATIPANATTASLALTVGGSVAAQTHALTVRGKATGLADATAPVSLVVTAASTPAITLAVSGSPVTVPQGGNGSVGITITRSGGFTGGVGLAVTGAPAGLTATLNPTTIPSGSTTSTLSLAAAANLAAQSYTLTVTASGTGVANKTATVTATVTQSSGSGNVTLDFSSCAAGSVLWVASQDGNGAWTQATGTNGIYKVTINSATGGIAYVLEGAGSSTSTLVQYMTKAELTGLGTVPFCANVSGKTVNGTTAGIAGTQRALISLGGAVAVALAAPPAFQLKGVRSGSHDLVAYRSDVSASTQDRVLIQRGLNPPDNGSVGLLDFGSTSAFAPESASVAVSGATTGQSVFQSVSYLTGAACDVHPLFTSIPGAATTLPIFGMPAAKQVSSDFHFVTVTAATATAGRSASKAFHTLGNQTVTLGASLGTPNVTVLSGPYKRLQAVVTPGADYNLASALGYEASGGGTASVSISATAGFVGGSTATLSMPDFSAVSGWSNAWAPGSSATTDWSVNAVGGTSTLCSEGARSVLAFVSGQN